ncbi:unnamed protein product, partial [Amaranthus hypochondriacus]
MGRSKKGKNNSKKPSLPCLQPQSEKKSSDSSMTELPDSLSKTIKQECEKALNAIRRGNHNKALRLLKDMSHTYENSALFHRVNGMISARVADIIDDPNTKQRHIVNAIESARKATELSPDSIEFAHFYANLLYEYANDGKGYSEVVSECERLLAIENPIDPLKDNTISNQQSDEKSPGDSTPDERIKQLRVEIQELILRSNLASISTWMKNLGGSPGEEKFSLIRSGRMLKDPLNSKYFDTSDSNSCTLNVIKKATKTPEERRKEIEVRVAAARLLQEKSEQGKSSEESKNVLSLVSGSVFGKVGERRRHGKHKRNSSSPERKDQVRSFLNSMSNEMKRSLLNVRVSDLQGHFNGLSSKDGVQACEIFSEALQFVKMSNSWKFWVCCRCGEKFSLPDTHMQHVLQDHLGDPLPKLQSVVPQTVDSEYAEMLVTCPWKPFDINASVRMLEDKKKSEDSEFYGRNNNEQNNDCWTESFGSKEVWESSPEKKSLSDGCNVGFCESKGDDGDYNIQFRTRDKNEGTKVYWPLSDDIERVKLLEKVSSLFQMLLRHKCFPMSLLQKVINFTMEKLQVVIPGSPILSSGVDETPLCICFLEAPQLEDIVKFLQEVSHSCDEGRDPEKMTPDEVNNQSKISGCEERILLSEDVSSLLLLDERLLDFEDTRTGGGSGYPTDVFVKDALSGFDSFLSWIYGCCFSAEVATWCRLREVKPQEGMEKLQMLEKEFGHLQSLCERKYRHMECEEALQGLEELCIEESKKKEHITEHSYHGYETLLRKRRDELVEGTNEILFVSNRSEHNAISNVLKEAENLYANHFGYEDTHASDTSDLDAGEEDRRSKGYLHQMDTYIKLAIRRQKEHMSAKLCKIDARILRNLANMKHLELELEHAAALDYHLIILPLVKSFMRAHIEDLAEKDAIEKSDAAREAFLAELELDSKKGTGNGNDSF